MLKTQIYSPDTCGCTIEEIWDTDNIEAPHTLSKIIGKCSEHVHTLLDTDVKVYNILLSENRKKNLLLGHLFSNNILPSTILNITNVFDPKTQTKKVSNSLSDGIVYNYYFKGDDPFNRQIVFSLEGLDKNGNILKFDNNQKASISNLLSLKLGAGTFQQVDQLHGDLLPEYAASLANRLKKTF